MLFFSAMTTGLADIYTQQVPMPICRYEIFSIENGVITDQIVQYATVGMPIYHKWTCDTETREQIARRHSFVHYTAILS